MGTNTSQETSGTTISLQDAMDRTNNWRQVAKPLFSNQINLVPKAFYVDMADIQALATKYPNATGVRAYFTLPTPIYTPAEGISAVIVPAQLMPDGTYKDIIISPPDDSTSSDTSIYDFTKPCPPCCDDSSDLN